MATNDPKAKQWYTTVVDGTTASWKDNFSGDVTIEPGEGGTVQIRGGTDFVNDPVCQKKKQDDHELAEQFWQDPDFQLYVKELKIAGYDVRATTHRLVNTTQFLEVRNRITAAKARHGSSSSVCLGVADGVYIAWYLETGINPIVESRDKDEILEKFQDLIHDKL